VTPIVSQLWRLLARYLGVPYGHDWPAEIDCSSLGSSLLREHYGLEVITLAVWQAINLSVAGVDPWEGIRALGTALGVEPVIFSGPTLPTKDRLHAFQVWSNLGEDGSIVLDQEGEEDSDGHFFLWLSYGGWLGVVIEANWPQGVRVHDAHGIHRLEAVVDVDGRLVADLEPMDLEERLKGWDQVAFVELP